MILRARTRECHYTRTREMLITHQLVALARGLIWELPPNEEDDGRISTVEEGRINYQARRTTITKKVRKYSFSSELINRA